MWAEYLSLFGPASQHQLSYTMTFHDQFSAQKRKSHTGRVRYSKHISIMAELALLASIVQIADTGYRLSLKLYTSGEAISSADRTIITISKDISLTSTVLKELGEILRRDQEEKESICSENLVQTAGNTVNDCLDAFEELDKMILKNMPNLSQGHRATRATMALEKLRWPFIQPRVQLLRGSLDMLRANISLMLNVLIYARHVSDRLVSR